MISKKTYVFQNRTQAECAKKAASQSKPILGCSFTTPEDLVSEGWELFGDGRGLVSKGERVLMVLSLLPGYPFDSSVGTARLLSEFISEAIGKVLDEYPDSKGIDSSDLSASFKAALMLVHDYADLIESRGLIEPVQTLGFLEEALKGNEFLLEKGLLIKEPYNRFLKALSCNETFEASDFYNSHDFLTQPSESDIRFLIPEGPDITSSMILREIDDIAYEGEGLEIAICCEDSKARFCDLSGPLNDRGFACALKNSVMLGSTSVGDATMSALTLIYGNEIEEAAIASATSFALSPFARIERFDSSKLPSMERYDLPSSLETASSLNTIWLSDRTLSRDDIIRDLIFLSPTFDEILNTFESANDHDGSFDSLRSSLIRIANSLHLEALDTELRAIDSISDACSSAIELGISKASLLEFLRTESIPSSRIKSGEESLRGNGCFAYFVSIADSLELSPGSFDIAILDNATDRVLNSKDAQSSELNDELGFVRSFKAADETKQLFNSIMRSARKRLICVLPELDEESKETYPSFAIVEMIDTLFPGKTFSDLKSALFGEDDGTPLSSFARSNCRTTGEGNLKEGIGRNFRKLEGKVELQEPVRGILESISLPSRMMHANDDRSHVLMSPSSVEKYLECHYKWFVESILKPESLQEGFGSLEKGTFAHYVMHRTYSRLIDEFGVTGFSDAPQEKALAMYSDTFDECLEEQYLLPPSSNRYVPCGSTEMIEARTLKDSIRNSLLLESALPHRFSETLMELQVGYGKGESMESEPERLDSIQTIREAISSSAPIEYGGVALHGRADRIDVDMDNQAFYVLDYKGSTSNHDAGCSVPPESPEALLENAPRYVQALIYASLIRKSLGKRLSCRAALYTSYKARSLNDLVIGSYQFDERELAELSDSKSAVCMQLDSYLEILEDALGIKLSDVYKSDISPCSEDKHICKYCLLNDCKGVL